MKYYVGFDGGSTYLKAALFDGSRVIDAIVNGTGIDNNGLSEKMLAELCQRNGVSRSSIAYIMATG